GFRVTAPAAQSPARRGRLSTSPMQEPHDHPCIRHRHLSAARTQKGNTLVAPTPQTPPSSSHPYPPLYRRRPVMSLIVERVISRLNARLISVAVNPDCRRVMIMARCRLLALALWCASP